MSYRKALASRRLVPPIAATIVIAAAPLSAQNLWTSAESEQPVAGTTLGGDYRSTFVRDDVCESIQEVETGGKPSKRTSMLEHLWALSIPAGDAHTLHFRAFLSDSGEGDAIELSWSADGASYAPLMAYEVADSGTDRSITLPPELSGALFIQMQDANRTQGRNALDTFAIDWMAVETVPPGGPLPPPPPPTDAVADGKSDHSILVGWTHDGLDEGGFRIERSEPGANAWVLAGTVGPDAMRFLDAVLTPSRTYDYQVIAFDAQGDSTPSSAATATTRAFGSFTSEPIAEERSLVDDSWLHWSHGLDSTGRVGVAVTAHPGEVGLYTPCNLYFFERDPGNGAWTGQLVAEDTFDDGRIVFEYGPDDVPRVAYRNPSYELRFAERVGGVWSTSTIDPPVVGQTPALAHDPLGRPAVAYVKHERRRYKDVGLWLIRRDGPGGTWSAPEQIDADPGARHPSMRWRASGAAAVAYSVLGSGVRYAVENGASWQIEVPDIGQNGLDRPSLSLHPISGEPTIAYGVYAQSFELWLTRRTASGWVPEHVTSNAYGDLQLVHDALGRELVGYYRWDPVANEMLGVFLATCTPGTFVEELVDPLDADGGSGPSLHRTAQGVLSLCYLGRLFPLGARPVDEPWLMLAWR